ncbi:MAG: serine hydrolase domain-containing protein [Chloroflexota bacterium]
MTTLTSHLEHTIHETMKHSRVAGLAIALIKDGELVAAEGYGEANVGTGAKITPDTRFSVMSVTKTIVSTAVMQLRDHGLLDLDAPVNQYLAPTHITNQWEAESPVTTRQLLTHTSGIPVGMNPPPGPRSLADFVDLAARTTHRPGTDMIYANWGFDAVGVLIERLSGKSVDVYLRESIFEPLGMTASALTNPADGEPRAYGHYRSALDEALRILPLPEWPTTPASPAGGVWSNVLDLSKFLIAHLSPYVGQGPSPDSPSFVGQGPSPDSIREMHSLNARQGSSESGQGIGFRVTNVNGRHTILHGGDGGGFTAYVAAHPEERAAVAMLMNTGGMQAARSIIGSTALASLAEPVRRTLGDTASVPEGVYASSFWDVVLEAHDDELIATTGNVMSEDPAASKLHPITPNVFEGEGGIFHGFEVTLEGDQLYGGIYPFTFTRTGDLPDEPSSVDEGAHLTGDWRGLVTTPLGPLSLTLHITSDSALTADTPFAQNVAAANVRAESGQVEGEFTVTVPVVGELQLFLRLAVRGGKLIGNTYGRSDFGEAPFATTLERT